MKRVVASTQYSEEDLAKMLKYISKNFKVNGPSHSGARMPTFNAYCVNESEFDHSLRFKYVDCSVSSDNKGLDIYWLTEDPFEKSEVQPLIDEISRCLSAMYDNYTKDSKVQYPAFPYIPVTVTVASRYGNDEGYYRATI